MRLSLSIGNRALYAVYYDKDNAPHIVKNGSKGYFDSYLWCDGDKAYFGEYAFRQSFNSLNCFFPNIINELYGNTNSEKYNIKGKEFGITGVLGLLLKDVKRKVISYLFSKQLISYFTENLEITLVVPTDIYNQRNLLEIVTSAVTIAGFRLIMVIPEYIAAVYDYNLNRNSQQRTLNIVHCDIGQNVKINFLKIKETEDVELISHYQANNIGINAIRTLLISHILGKLAQQDELFSSLDNLENQSRNDFEVQIDDLIHKLLNQPSELEFNYLFENGSGISIPIKMHSDSKNIFDIDSDDFIYENRIAGYATIIKTLIANSLQDYDSSLEPDFIILSGAGCQMPLFPDIIADSIRSHTGAKIKRSNHNYSEILAFGGAKYSEIKDTECISRLDESQKKIAELVNSIETEPSIILIPQPSETQLKDQIGDPYDIPSNVKHINIQIAGNNVTGVINRESDRGACSVSNSEDSCLDDGIEYIGNNTYHLCFSKLKDDTLFLALSSTMGWNKTNFEIRLYNTVEPDRMLCVFKQAKNTPSLQYNPVNALQIYLHRSSWRAKLLLEPINDSTPIPFPPKPKPIPIPPKTEPKPVTTPINPPPESLSAVKKMIPGQRTPVNLDKYTLDIGNNELTLYVILEDMKQNVQILTAQSKSADNSFWFEGNYRCTLDLAKLVTNETNAVYICYGSSNKNSIKTSISVSIQDHKAKENYVFETSIKSVSNSSFQILAFYAKNGKWKMLSEIEPLPKERSLELLGVSVTNITKLKTKTPADNNSRLILGQRTQLNDNITGVRLDIINSFTDDFELSLWGSTNNKNASIINTYNKKCLKNFGNLNSAIGLSFQLELNKLALSEYSFKFYSPKVLDDNAEITISDISTGSLIGYSKLKSDVMPKSECNLFKLYLHKSKWKIAYIFD